MICPKGRSVYMGIPVGAFVNQLRGIPVLYPLQFLNPLTYGVDAIRALLTGMPPNIPLWTDFLVLLGFAIVLVLLGGYSFSKMEVD